MFFCSPFRSLRKALPRSRNRRGKVKIKMKISQSQFTAQSSIPLQRVPFSRALVYSADNRFAVMTDIEGHFEFILPKEESETASNNGSVIYSSSGSATYSSFGPIRLGRGSQMWLRARKPGFLEDEGRGGVMTTASPGVDATIAIVPRP